MESQLIKQKELVKLEIFNGELLPVTDSLRVAEVTDKRHSEVLRDIKELIHKLMSNHETEIIALRNFAQCSYINSNNREMPMYLMTKEAFENLMFTYNGTKMVVAKAKFIRKFHEIEEELKNNQQTKLPKNYKEALQQLIEQEEEKERLQIENKQKEEVIKQQAPKVIFADAVSASHTSILVGDLAKILKQNGVDTGQKRFFEWLRSNGFLIKRQGSDYNMPTQKSMEMGLFEIKEGTRVHSDGHISVTRTTKVTGKGQIYFINKLKPEEILALA